MSPVYLDNAATSFPKPEAVYTVIDHYQRHVGAAVGRGAYHQAIEAQGVVDRCRKRAAELLGAESRDRIIFTFNGTDSLNVALHGLLGPGDHVVTSVLEHNSVLRPLNELADRFGVEITAVAPRASGQIEPADVREALRPNTKLVALIHTSNVTGTVQPIADVGGIARSAGVLFLVDAAQSAGHWPIDLANLPVDILACPGHKGLLGPLGTGLLYLRPGVEGRLRSFRQGGTGSVSENERQPETLPDKYEPGNHNTPGLYGLEAGLAFLQERGLEGVSKHEHDLTTRLLEGLSGLPRLRVFGHVRGVPGTGVVSLTIEGFEPQVLAAILDESFHIQSRAGLHCAPGAHRWLGTLKSGGTLRLSVGAFTTAEEIDAAVAALSEIAASM